MSLIPYTRALNGGLEGLMQDFFGQSPLWGYAPKESNWTAHMEVRDLNDKVLVRAEVPGVKEEDLDVTYEDGVLTIIGKKESDWTEDTEGRQYSERYYGEFRRSVRLPEDVDGDKVTANLSDGILELSFEKLEDKKPRTIKISRQ